MSSCTADTRRPVCPVVQTWVQRDACTLCHRLKAPRGPSGNPAIQQLGDWQDVTPPIYSQSTNLIDSATTTGVPGPSQGHDFPKAMGRGLGQKPPTPTAPRLGVGAEGSWRHERLSRFVSLRSVRGSVHGLWFPAGPSKPQKLEEHAVSHAGPHHRPARWCVSHPDSTRPSDTQSHSSNLLFCLGQSS